MSPIGSGFARRSLRKDQVPVVKLVYRELYGLLEFSLQCNSIAMLVRYICIGCKDVASTSFIMYLFWKIL